MSAVAGTSVVVAFAFASVVVVGAGASSPSTRATLAQARGQLLTKADMPSGWVSQKNSNSSGGGGFPGLSRLAHCIGVPTSTIKSNPPSVSSPQFSTSSQSLNVSENIAAFTSTKSANRQYAAFTNRKTPGCFQQILNGPLKSQLTSSFGSGVRVGHISVTKTTIGSLTGLTLSFSPVSNGHAIPVTITDAIALHGLEGMQLEFASIGSAFPSSLEQQLATLAAGRL